MGEDPIPDVLVKLNVKEFGAKGDGITDDSDAFLQAIDAIEDGAIYIPPGRYKITKVIEITKSNVVLRGAGPDATVLHFPKHLGDVLGPGDAPAGTPYWSWKGGLIEIDGRSRGRKLAPVFDEALRGDITLELAPWHGINPGQMVQLHQSDSGDGSYLKHLHADQTGGGSFRGAYAPRFTSRVKDVQGSTIVLDRPLRTDVRLKWQPEIYAYDPSVREVGIENLTMEFPKVEYRGHLKELGYNGIQVRNATDCWVRNLKLLNADGGIFLDSTRFCTIQNVYFGAYEGRALDVGNLGMVSGHHAMQTNGDTEDNFFTGFEIDTRFIHDITVLAGASGNVFSKGKGIDLNFDHHGRNPFENLFTDLDVGKGDRVWMSSGNTKIGSHSGARETFWNLRSQAPLSWPDHILGDSAPHIANPWGPDQMNLIGITTMNEPVMTRDGKWFEIIDPDKLFPQNLHLAQLSRRLRNRLAP